MTQRHCPACKAFMSARARGCGRCRDAAKTTAKRAQAAERDRDKRRQRELRELTKLRDKAKRDAWRLPRLQQAIDGRRKTSHLGPEDWDPLVHSVFGAPPDAIVDPRQMSLFG